ncbi:MAG: hypothetical protein M0024_10215 [Nitrospiraceae bacterium]|nr:hypothetical protein [Nitrospiraceae bacterium]
MRKRPGREPVPAEHLDTVRHDIIHALDGRTLSALEISAEVSVSEKEVYEHLGHIMKSLSGAGRVLHVTPAECLKCGFVFKKRDRLKKPGRCPLCRGEQIQEPLFSVQ